LTDKKQVHVKVTGLPASGKSHVTIAILTALQSLGYEVELGGQTKAEHELRTLIAMASDERQKRVAPGIKVNLSDDCMNRGVIDRADW
jgi:adenylylsulfate kinase-like enzyme